MYEKKRNVWWIWDKVVLNFVTEPTCSTRTTPSHGEQKNSTRLSVSTCSPVSPPGHVLLRALEKLAQREEDFHFPYYLHQVNLHFLLTVRAATLWPPLWPPPWPSLTLSTFYCLSYIMRAAPVIPGQESSLSLSYTYSTWLSMSVTGSVSVWFVVDWTTFISDRQTTNCDLAGFKKLPDQLFVSELTDQISDVVKPQSCYKVLFWSTHTTHNDRHVKQVRKRSLNLCVCVYGWRPCSYYVSLQIAEAFVLQKDCILTVFLRFTTVKAVCECCHLQWSTRLFTEVEPCV